MADHILPLSCDELNLVLIALDHYRDYMAASTSVSTVPYDKLTTRIENWERAQHQEDA